MRILLLCLSLVTLLSGCAVNNIQNTQLTANQPLQEGHGVVVVQLVNNADRLAPLHKGWTEVIAFRTDNIDEKKAQAIADAKERAKNKGIKVDPDKVDWDPDMYSLLAVNQGTVDSQLFVGSMPKGTYMISTLYSFFTNGDMSSWLTMPVMFSAGRFDVESNYVSDLGTVVFQPLLSIKEKSFWSSSSKSKAFVTRVTEQQNLSDFVLSHYPAIEAGLRKDKVLTWEDDGLDSFRAQLGELSRQNAYAAKAVRMNESAVGALASKFGQLRLLKSDGTWKHIDLPTNSQVSAVFEKDDNIIIGGERGQLFTLQKGKWVVSHPVSAKEAIVWFGKGDGINFAMTSSAKRYTSYTFDRIDDVWKKIGTFNKKNPNDWLVQNGGLFPFVTKAGKLRVLNDNKLYDFDGEQWVNKKSTSMRNLAQLESGILVAVEVSQWDGVGDQVFSVDDGDTWTTIERRLNLFGDTKTDVSLPGYTTSKGLVTLGRIKPKGKGKVSGLKILTTDIENSTNRNDWAVHGDAKEGCHSFLPQLTHNDRLYFLCDQGQIVSTDDFGLTWNVDVDIDLAAMTSAYELFVEELIKDSEKKSTQIEEKDVTTEE